VPLHQEPGFRTSRRFCDCGPGAGCEVAIVVGISSVGGKFEVEGKFEVAIVVGGMDQLVLVGTIALEPQDLFCNQSSRLVGPADPDDKPGGITGPTSTSGLLWLLLLLLSPGCCGSSASIEGGGAMSGLLVLLCGCVGP
jgi:hypothetical protein